MKNFFFYLLPLLWLVCIASGQLSDLNSVLTINEDDGSNVVDFASNLISVKRLVLSRSKMKTVTASILSKFPNLKVLEMQDSQIEDFEPGAFSENKNLETISLSKNQIRNLSNLFSALSGSPSRQTITLLDLQLNKIEELIPLPNLSSLEQVYLNGNLIKNLDGRVFKNLAALQRVNLANNLIGSIAADSFNYIKDPARKFSLFLQNNKLQSFPAVIEACRDAFIDILHLGNNQIEQLVEIDSRLMVSRLILSSNKIRDLGRTPILKNNFFIKELTLAFNQIERIEPGVFSGLNLPLRLSLASNAFNDTANLGGLEGTMIEQLDLSMNQFSALGRLPQMDMLTSVTLNSNQIQELNLYLFDNLPNLSTISLESNLIKSVKPGTFKIRNNTQKLNIFLGYNMLENFSSLISALADDPIQDLSLDGNYFLELSEIPSMPQLRNISICSNKLSSLSAGYFKNAPSLKKIDLRSNLIFSISAEFIQSVKNVDYIGLLGNYLERAPELKYMGGSSLDYIDLSYQGGAFRIKENAFERMMEPFKTLAPLVVNLIHTQVVEVSPRAFCSNYSTHVDIIQIQMSLETIKLMDKCTLRQLRNPVFGVEVLLSPEVNPSDQDLTEYCGCGFTRLFALKYSIRFSGICDRVPNINCPVDLNSILDDCSQQSQYKCAREESVWTTTPAPETTITTVQKTSTSTTSSSASSSLSSFAIAAIVIGSGLLLVVAFSIPFIFNRLK